MSPLWSTYCLTHPNHTTKHALHSAQLGRGIGVGRMGIRISTMHYIQIASPFVHAVMVHRRDPL
jgi:hypothetical protein